MSYEPNNKPKTRGPNWSDAENELLRNVWPDMGIQCAHLFPGRTKKSITTHAEVLKVRRNGRKYTPKKDKPDPGLMRVIRGRLADDEPLVSRRGHNRTVYTGFGFIKSGPVRSVFDLGAAL